MPTRCNHTYTLLTLLCIRLYVYISIHFPYAPACASTIAHQEGICPTYSLDDASMCLQKAPVSIHLYMSSMAGFPQAVGYDVLHVCVIALIHD